MDGFAGHQNGEAATAFLAYDDVVTFKKKGGAHGDRGLVVCCQRQGTTQDDKLAVICVDGAVVYEDAGDLAVVDRSYIRRGELVASASDPGGQIGVVTKATTSLDLVQLGINGGEPVPAARGVSPAELRRVRELSVGDYVVSGRWLGRVMEVSVDIDVLIGGGVVCRVADAGDDKLEAVPALRHGDRGDGLGPMDARGPSRGPMIFQGRPWLEVIGGQHGHRQVTDTFFHPGQRVKSSPRLNGIGSFEGTVAKVEMGAVLVHWVASAVLGTNRDRVNASAPPAYQQNPHDLTLFDSCGDCYWGVGDRCFFRKGESSPQPRKKTLFKLGIRRREETGDELRPVQVERPMSVADTRTTADVLWQDGTRWRSMPSASLVPVDILNDYEFLPGERVISKVADGAEISAATGVKDLTAADAAPAAGSAARYGVVRSVDARDQTVRVSWFDTTEHGGEVESDETVGTYDLVLEYYDDEVFYGNVVVRLQPSETAMAANDLSWVGHAIDLCDDGCVQVKWGDGTTSKVLPHEISVVEEQSTSEMEEEMGDWMANDAMKEERENKNEDHAVAAAVLSHEISVVEEQTISEMVEELDDWVAIDGAVNEAQDDTNENYAAATELMRMSVQSAGNVTDDNQGNGEAGTPALSGITQGLRRLAAELRAKGKRLVRDPEATPRSEHAAMENVVRQPNRDGSETMVVQEDVDSNVCADEKSSANARGDASFHFPQFDVVQLSPPDHYFLKDAEQGIDGGNKCIKRVQERPTHFWSPPFSPQ